MAIGQPWFWFQWPADDGLNPMAGLTLSFRDVSPPPPLLGPQALSQLRLVFAPAADDGAGKDASSPPSPQPPASSPSPPPLLPGPPLPPPPSPPSPPPPLPPPPPPLSPLPPDTLLPTQLEAQLDTLLEDIEALLQDSIVPAKTLVVMLLLVCSFFCVYRRWGCSEECLERCDCECSCFGSRWTNRSDKGMELKLSLFEMLLRCCCYDRRLSQRRGGYDSALSRYVQSQADSSVWGSQRKDSVASQASCASYSTHINGSTRNLQGKGRSGSRLPATGEGGDEAAGSRKSVRIATPEEEEQARARAGATAPAACDAKRHQRPHWKASTPTPQVPSMVVAAAGTRSSAAAARARVPGLRVPDRKPVTDSPEAAAPRKPNGGGGTLRTRLRGMRRRFFDRERSSQQAPRAMPHAAPFPRPQPQKKGNPGFVQL